MKTEHVRRPALLFLALAVALAALPLWAASHPAASAPAAAGTFGYTVPPKPGSNASRVRPIPHPPGLPVWARRSLAPAPPAEGAGPRLSSTGYQSTGDIRAVTLAVDFSDKAATVSLSHYDDLLFDTAGYPDTITKSMRAYYREGSYSALNVTGDVYGAAKSSPSAWVNWLRAPRTYAYYAINNGLGTYPRNAQRLTEDTVKAVDSYVNFASFTTYQATEGGVTGAFVSALFVVHAGPGAEETGSSTDIWSHSWVTRLPIRTNDTTAGGQPIYVYRYIIMAEDSPMGTFGHEFGHTLGLPDLYDYDNSSAGVGIWSMMSYGSWKDNGNTPTQMDAWSKVAVDWVSPTTVSGSSAATLANVEQNPVIFKLPTGRDQEYFLLENRQPLLFDSGLPGAGLLIWHIDDAVADNDDETHFHVALEQADGLYHLESATNAGDSGDPYPGNSGNTGFSPSSSPSSLAYSGAATGVMVTGIGQSAGGIDVVVTAVLPTPVKLTSFTARGQQGAVALAWTTASEVNNLGFNLYRATSPSGRRSRVNAQIIPTKTYPGSPAGASYTYSDRAVKKGLTYYYWLEDIGADGSRGLHGPVKATVTR